MSSPWSHTTFGTVVCQRKELITIDDMQVYKRCRVQLHAQGIVLRDLVPGTEVKTKQQQVCRAGEFLVAEIDAKVGGFGIVPMDLDGAIVSSHYFLFEIDESKLDRRFLDFYTRTPAFRDQVKAQGSTNYAAIRPSDVLGYQIPLPPLDEQRRIVARIEELAGKIEQARGLRQEVLGEADAIIQAARHQQIDEIAETYWVPLHRHIASIENGKSPACESRPALNEEWGVLKVGAVSFGYFNARENKALPLSIRPEPSYEVKQGDFLMSRANTSSLAGACAVVQETRPKLMLSDKIFRFVFKDVGGLNKSYLDHVLKSPALRDQIIKGATGTSPTMKNISKQKVLNLRIPVPSLERQQHIVTILEGMQSKTDALKRMQAETAAELDALLPAVLDRAFKGELV